MSKTATLPNRLVSLAQAILILGASTYLLVYLVISLARISYPFELEWMEGGSVIHVQRILDGQPLYIPPSLDFIPYIYPPFYYQVSSLFARFTGNGFLPLRLVSLLSSLGCFVLIFMIVHRRTASPYAACLAVCLFAATFPLSGFWLDLARVDALFLLLLLASIFTFESSEFILCSFVSPLLLFLSYFTKQTALMVAVFLSVAAFLVFKRTARFWFALNFSLLLAGSFLIMNALTNGWYKYYVFDLPTQHEIISGALAAVWTDEIIQNLWIALCICIVSFINIRDTSRLESGRLIQDLAILGSLLLASYLSRIHSGSFDNSLMPAHAGIALYFGIGAASAFKATSENYLVKFLLILAFAFQFVGLRYSPQAQIPTQIDRQQGERLEQLISSFKGEVYLSAHPWYLSNANKPTQAQEMAILDIIRASQSGQLGHALRTEMDTAIVEGRYEAFIIDAQDFILRVPSFDTHYQLAESNLGGGAFHPVTGWDRSPTYLYVKRNNR